MLFGMKEEEKDDIAIINLNRQKQRETKPFSVHQCEINVTDVKITIINGIMFCYYILCHFGILCCRTILIYSNDLLYNNRMLVYVIS